MSLAISAGWGHGRKEKDIVIGWQVSLLREHVKTIRTWALS